MNLLLLANNQVGYEIAQWLLTEYRDDVALVVTTSENEISLAAQRANVANLVYESAAQVSEYINSQGLEPDIGVLAWWPYILKNPLLGFPKHGFINTHPSLLPYNRGKHYNFWVLVEQVPFGVSLHLVEEGIDCGDIIAQAEIPYGWEDNGGSLYAKSCEAMVGLFKETYPVIRTLDIPRVKQDLNAGSFHLAKELDQASFLHLEDQYKVRDLLNLLRARTFSGRPACWFNDAGDEYEVRIEINRKI